MKKLILSVVITTMTLSLTGCGTKSNLEIEELNEKLENSYQTISELEKKVDELSDKLEEQSNELSDSNEIELDYYNKNDGIVEIRVDYLQNDYEKSYEEYIEKLKSQGKNVIAAEKVYGQTLFIIETTEVLKNVTYSGICNDFMDECGMDIETSIMKHGLSNDGDLAKELKPGQTLVFAVHESEGIPMGYFYWTEESGRVVYNAITFDGSGERYTYN